MDHDHDPILSPLSLKQKLKHSLPLSSCFTKSRCHHQHHPPRLTRCSSGHTPDAKFKSCNFFSRNFGGGPGGYTKHTRRHSSADFSYDAMSYALNFDEGCGGDDRDEDDSPIRSFTSRLPRSPDRAL